jgi:hypothetical protein
MAQALQMDRERLYKQMERLHREANEVKSDDEDTSHEVTRESIRRASYNLKTQQTLEAYREDDSHLKRRLLECYKFCEDAITLAMEVHHYWELPTVTGIRYPPEVSSLGAFHILAHVHLNAIVAESGEIAFALYDEKRRGRRHWYRLTPISHSVQISRHLWTSRYAAAVARSSLRECFPRHVAESLSELIRFAERAILFHAACESSIKDIKLSDQLLYVATVTWQRSSGRDDVATFLKRHHAVLKARLREEFGRAPVSEWPEGDRAQAIVAAYRHVFANYRPKFYSCK